MLERGLKQLILNNTRQLKLDEVVNAAKFVQQHSLLLFQFTEGISVLNREECSWDPHSGYTVIVTSIFLLGFTWNSINGFTCLLGLYLQALSVKCYILSFLYSFSLIDSYKTLNTKKFRLAEYSKESLINSAGFFSTNSL